MRKWTLFVVMSLLPAGGLCLGAVVTLDDGTALVGTPDPGTTAQELHWREGSPRCYLVSRLSWNRVQTVAEDGLTLSAREYQARWARWAERLAQLQQKLQALESQEETHWRTALTPASLLDANQFLQRDQAIRAGIGRQQVAALLEFAAWCDEQGYTSASQAAYVTVLQLDPDNAEAVRRVHPDTRRLCMPAAGRPAAGRVIPPPVRPPDRVARIETASTVVNWDGDAQLDGLVLELLPIDDQGRLVAVDGWLEVELIGQRARSRRSPNDFVRLEAWNVKVARDRFTPHGLQIRLPFNAYRPDDPDLAVIPVAKLRACLSVAGQGEFRTEEPVVRLRPYDPLGEHREHVRSSGFSPSP